MSGSVTPRDLVWRAALEKTEYSRTKVERVHRAIDREHRPNKETVRRTMKAMSELGVLDHSSGSPYWRRTD